MKNLFIVAAIAIASIHCAFGQTPLDENSIPANDTGIIYQAGQGASDTKNWTHKYGTKMTVWHSSGRNFELLSTQRGINGRMAFRTYDGTTSTWQGWRLLLNKDEQGRIKFDVNSAYSTASSNLNGDILIQGNTTEGNNLYGAAVSFSKLGGGENKRASIVSKQTSGDNDNIGLAFLTHSNTAADPLRERMLITGDGKVGIGIAAPAGVLHVNSFSTLGGTTDASKAALVVQANGGKLMMDENEIYGTNNLSIGANYNKPITFFHIDASNRTERMRIAANGNVGIGVDNPTEALSVDGTILSEKVVVDPDFSSVPDYVFEEDYHLQPLSEVKAYIQKNKHLPEIPSASEMVENGLELTEMSLLLLKKIEEMTLHQIELMEEVERLKNKVKELEEK
ncbi:MAG: hypothetical protein AAGJ93_17660 [Bacteroidota bacterium]